MTKPTSIYMGCPVYGNAEAAFEESHRKLLASKRTHQLVYQPIYDMPDPSPARNILASMFLDTDLEYYLSLDSDMQFTMQDIERLVSREKKVIGGLYRKAMQSREPIWVLNPLPGQTFDPKAGEVQEVLTIGTGFLLIHRSVFERIKEAFPRMEYDAWMPDGSKKVCWDFFCEPVRERRRLSGDWGFCLTCRDIGEKVFVDCARKLPHHGKAVY